MSIGPGGRRKFFETNDHEDRMSEPSAVPSRPQRSLRKLPKAHLHVHLDGSYPLYAVEALARRRRMAFRVPGRFPSVQSFFDAYLTVPNLVESHEDLAGLCRALVHADAADGVVYMEPAIEPQLYAPRIGTLDQVTKTMMRAFAEASMDAGIEVGALLTINTDGDLEIAEDLAGIAAAYAGRGITGLGTAGFVEPGNLRRYRSSAKIAQAVGLPATRISHGFRAIECTDMVKRLADEQIVCDMCPVSNVRLGVVSGMCNHPAPSMLAAGVQITLNADDSLWFSAGVTDQYTVARDEWGLADAQIARFARAGALATGMSDSSRARLLDGIDAWMNGDTL
jgi:adenosine deaminase